MGFIEIIVVRKKALTRRVMEHRGRLQAGNEQLGHRGDPVAQKLQDEIAVIGAEVTLGIVAHGFVRGTAADEIEHLRRAKPRACTLDDPVADLG